MWGWGVGGDANTSFAFGVLAVSYGLLVVDARPPQAPLGGSRSKHHRGRFLLGGVQLLQQPADPGGAGPSIEPRTEFLSSPNRDGTSSAERVVQGCTLL
eukprot:CAMPEP_0119357044 /NCGR_PEP_ID=MMETSP1334-20130426/5506_1 /TAXON_ID=127549 /ORGANISM="Calcidiscus leptoporus, Strain RCC1130" /LENGTH=98 /DNA_ID=CAMNT_0007371201 /DNA_START=240 /DNA_END=536 /DNA_ORIENTATION=+